MRIELSVQKVQYQSILKATTIRVQSNISFEQLNIISFINRIWMHLNMVFVTLTEKKSKTCLKQIHGDV